MIGWRVNEIEKDLLLLLVTSASANDAGRHSLVFSELPTLDFLP